MAVNREVPAMERPKLAGEERYCELSRELRNYVANATKAFHYLAWLSGKSNSSIKPYLV
jgi:hypothetical protein